jgi:hypothetical protein
MNKGTPLYKVSGILAIVFGSIMCMGFVLLFPAIIGITMILGGISFMKYADLSANELKSKNNIIVFFIVLFFIFGGVITGVLALCAYLDSKESFDYNSNEVQENIDKDTISKLERINNLRKDGLLTEDEYNSLKNDIINKK